MLLEKGGLTAGVIKAGWPLTDEILAKKSEELCS